MARTVPALADITEQQLRDIRNQLPDADVSGDSDYAIRANAVSGVALLSDWERVLALPVSTGMTIQARRQQIMVKLNETGGLSRSYFIRLAKSLGYEVTIDEPEPFRCGRNRCGDRLWVPEIIWV